MSRILIVEDEARIASFIEKGLRGQGHTPTVISDGTTGLDYALTGDFDLMVLDVGLPGMDGLTLLARLRERGSTLPVVVLTARDSVETTMSALEGGATTTCASRSASTSWLPASACVCAHAATTPGTLNYSSEVR